MEEHLRLHPRLVVRKSALRSALGARAEPSDPAHRLTVGVSERIHSEISLQRVCPAQAAGTRSFCLSEEEEDRCGCSPL